MDVGLRTVDELKTKDVLNQVLEAVAYLHNKNIIHRDINPTNILMFSGDPGLHCKLCDYGQAKLVNLNSMPVGPSGLIPFMPWEMILNRQYDHKVDIYACGILAFQMLTGTLGPPGIEACKTPVDARRILTSWKPDTHLSGKSRPACRLISSMLKQNASLRPNASLCLENE